MKYLLILGVRPSQKVQDVPGTQVVRVHHGHPLDQHALAVEVPVVHGHL